MRGSYLELCSCFCFSQYFQAVNQIWGFFPPVVSPFQESEISESVKYTDFISLLCNGMISVRNYRFMNIWSTFNIYHLNELHLILFLKCRFECVFVDFLQVAVNTGKLGAWYCCVYCLQNIYQSCVKNLNFFLQTFVMMKFDDLKKCYQISCNIL